MNKSADRFRNSMRAGTFFLLVIMMGSCKGGLSEERATELVRLNYRQQSTTEGAGTWMIDTIIINRIERRSGDSLISYSVTAFTQGIYQLPALENAPRGYSENFFDTIRFVAKKQGEVWMADDWTITGSRHE